MMIWKTVILLGLAICAQGRSVATSEQKLEQKFIPEHHHELDHIGSHKPEHHGEYASAYPSYKFSYSVNDPHTHDHKGQRESREGDEVKGEYWLLQPDGKKRTVQYYSDKHNGLKAQVHYSDYYHHIKEPHIEEIIKPVVEIVDEEPQLEEVEPIRVIEEEKENEENVEGREEERREERLEEPREERQEERQEDRSDVSEKKHDEERKEKHHWPMHVKYYIEHKYHKQEHKEHEKLPEPVVKYHKKELSDYEHHKNSHVKHRKPIHIEHYTKIHHPVYKHHEPIHHEPVHHEEEHKEENSKELQDRISIINFKPLLKYGHRTHHSAVPLQRTTIKRAQHDELRRADEFHAQKKQQRVPYYGHKLRYHRDHRKQRRVSQNKQ